MKIVKTLLSFVVMTLFAFAFAGSAESESSTTSSSNENEDEYAYIKDAVKDYYPDFMEFVSVEKLPDTSDYDYRFTVVLKGDRGITCKQNGFVTCYSNGEVSNVVSYGYPFDFKDRKGNEMHDPTGNGLY